eukprot:COSAG06_NODE_159_length_21747_cov_5.504111_10_plen_57_part_00
MLGHAAESVTVVHNCCAFIQPFVTLHLLISSSGRIPDAGFRSRKPCKLRNTQHELT